MSDENFHALAKDAGNRLKNYILGYASGATGVFFLALSGDNVGSYSLFQQFCLIVALVFFVATVALCLYELHIDARRFFNIAFQNSRPASERSWELNEHYKKLRVRLIYASYITVALGTIASVAFLVARVT
ncbi:MAG: hypothetical protein FNT29_09420 [Halothiobacillaceae bacterium]|nr:MAG: hypothetical protein FNT29_09420 [Halothiobacillaceae bacterium]